MEVILKTFYPAIVLCNFFNHKSFYTEKELLYSEVVVQGHFTELCFEMQKFVQECRNLFGNAATVAYMNGWLKTFQQYKFLRSLNYYFRTYQKTAYLAFEISSFHN